MIKNKTKTIGIVGGGQLGRMLANAAHQLGFKVIILDPTKNSPAGQVADREIIGSFKDEKKILELAKLCDFMTFEIESANEKALEKIVKKGLPVNPSPQILQMIKDKFWQKVFLKENGIKTAEFALIENEEDCIMQGKIFGYPFLLKARFDAYDGRGNFVLKSEKDIPQAFKKLSHGPLYAERFVPFQRELSVVSARDFAGSVASFPTVETIHKNNICHIVRSPAPISIILQKKAEKVAKNILGVLKGVGVFAVEMFLTKEGDILVNEIAPRVHNSGHHTLEAFNVSQFEEHIRAISGMPLLPIKKTANVSVMINILGERQGKALLRGVKKAKFVPRAKVHIYGKMETRLERKMGHITVLGNTLKKTEKKALEVRRNISI